MKRYRLNLAGRSMHKEEDGTWVRYEDAEKLKRERDKAVSLVRDWEYDLPDCECSLGPQCLACRSRAFLAFLEEREEG